MVNLFTEHVLIQLTNLKCLRSLPVICIMTIILHTLQILKSDMLWKVDFHSYRSRRDTSVVFLS